MTTGRRLRYLAAFVAFAALAPACTRTLGEGDPDVESARRFSDYPLYWVGERFRAMGPRARRHGQSELRRVDVRHLELDVGIERGCSPPLQIQIQPLCADLDVVARAGIWMRRQVREAPVGTIDSAPVLFSDRVQVKVYRSQGSDPGLAIRALRALRSANEIEPVLGFDDPIPPAPRLVLAGAAPCTSPG